MSQPMELVDSTGDEAIAAAISIFGKEGLAAISFRSIGKISGIHPATLHFRYGTKRALLDEVFSVIAEQEAQAYRQRGTLAQRAHTMVEATELYRQAVCGGGEGARDRDLALIEMLIAAVRDRSLRPHADKWLNQVQRCWAAAFGFRQDSADLAWFLTELQIGLLVASIGAGRPLETAIANGEIIARVLSAQPEDGHGWFAGFFGEAREKRPFQSEALHSDSQRERLLRAGAESAAEQGAAGMSFRSVASRAGVTLSAAIRAFPTRQHLINAVFDRISDELAFSSSEANATIRDEAAAARYFIDVMLDRQFAGANLILALAELYAAAARHASLHDLSWSMRMTQGNDFDLAGADPHSVAAFDSHIMALWSLGCMLTHAACLPDTRTLLSHRVPCGLRLLAPRVSWGGWQFKDPPARGTASPDQKI